MISKSDVEHIKQFEKAKMQFYDYTNYFFLLFPIGFELMGFSIFNSFIKNNLKIELFFTSFLMILLGLIFTYVSFKRLNENLRFTLIENNRNLDLKDLKTNIENNLKITNIYINEELRVLIVSTKLTSFSWGEVITIVQNGNKYLVNSKPNGQPITFYKDKENVKTVSAIIEYKN